MKNDVLNLPMRKQFAIEILKGEKLREYRAATDHWCKIMGVFGDKENPNLLTDVKQFKKAHFYPYNNKWFLDCEIKAIICATIDDEFISHFGGEYEGEKGDAVFIIRLGKVIDTNLTI